MNRLPRPFGSIFRLKRYDCRLSAVDQAYPENNPEKLTQSAAVAIQLLNKIVSDERVHVRILSELAQSVAAEEGKEA